MWTFQKVSEHAKLVENLKRRRVDGVAAKIAEKVSMFFEDDHVDAHPSQQIAEHDSGGTASDYAAARGEPLHIQNLSNDGRQSKLGAVRRVRRRQVSASNQIRQSCPGNTFFMPHLRFRSII